MMSRIAKNIPFKIFYGSIEPRISTERIQIPEFQRNFVWGKDKIQELFTAINGNDDGYYIGNIVTIKSDSGTSGREKVLDGQQRLVSLSLLFIAIYHKSVDPAIKNRIKKYIFDSSGGIRIEFSKDTINSVFHQIINNSIITSPLDDSQKKIVSAYEYIFEEYYDSVSDIEQLIGKIENVEFVVMNCETDDEVYQIFEGLNSTGLSLGQTDLIKNSILSRIRELDPSKVDYFYNLWTDIECLFEEKHNQNTFIRFIRQQFYSINGYLGVGSLFKKIKEVKITSSNISNIEQYLSDLSNDAEIYLKLKSGDGTLGSTFTGMPIDDSIESGLIISSLAELGHEQIYSVLLAFIKYGHLNNEYFRSRFLKHLKKLYAFALLVKYSKISPAAYERKFATICKDISGMTYANFKTKTDTFFIELYHILSSLTEATFIEKIMNYPIGKFYSEIFIRKLLRDIYSSDKLHSLEHIVPKNFGPYWGALFHGLKKREIEKFILSLGNLAIIEEKLNNDIGDREFAYKASNGYDISSLRDLMDEIVLFDFNSNPQASVKSRGELLAHKIFNYYHGVTLTP